MRVFSSLAGLNSVFFFFGDALQNATQLFVDRIPQMTKYFAMKECENIPITPLTQACELCTQQISIFFEIL
jgi:hypothetical protein